MSNKKPSVLRLNPADNVVVALENLDKGTEISTEKIQCLNSVPAGHKIATASVAAGKPVVKYGQIIGPASKDIQPGQHVHSHNLSMGDFNRDHAIGSLAKAPEEPPKDPAYFSGIVRPDGRVATRNYIAVVGTVNCSSSVCRFISREIEENALKDFPNVDGVVPLVHGSGCAMSSGGEGREYLANAVDGYIRHPNFAGIVVVGLGCEVLQVDDVAQKCGLAQNRFFKTLNIQDSGGVAATVEKGAAFIRDMLPRANQTNRTRVSADRIVLGLECGGSDGYSGITANPALGAAVDLLILHGGTAILGETPEIYGAEHLLTQRAANMKTGEKLLERIAWWEEYTARNQGEMDNNPSPGNKAGGLTTIAEKSLGAVAKAGSANLVEVVKYARPVREKGLVFMDTPGYDPVSVTGMIAGGANMVCFTTGRGSVFGSRPAPCLKLATNSEMFFRMEPDMDINCGEILDRGVSVQEMGQRIFEHILRCASGEKSRSEASGMGNDEFVPWHIGAVM